MENQSLMNQSDIALRRLASQHLAGTKFTTPKEIVARMAAMQAQDYPMAKWAIGIRLPGSDDALIESTLDQAHILRTHVLRPTWHFVAAEDIYWLLELSTPRIKAGQKGRDRQLELTEPLYTRSNAIIERALSKGQHLRREELIDDLNQAGIRTDQNRASHLLMRAELDKIICSGASRDGKLTYALLPERAPQTKRFNREETLAELASRYFTSRSPARLKDCAW